jgi:hypothetical protein
VLRGDNKDVERRHKHYVVNSPSVDLFDTIKESSEQIYPEKSTTNIAIKEKKRQKHKDDKIETKDSETREIQYENNGLIDRRKRKKRSILVLD